MSGVIYHKSDKYWGEKNPRRSHWAMFSLKAQQESTLDFFLVGLHSEDDTMCPPNWEHQGNLLLG